MTCHDGRISMYINVTSLFYANQKSVLLGATRQQYLYYRLTLPYRDLLWYFNPITGNIQ
jgi:hypothetical protein